MRCIRYDRDRPVEAVYGLIQALVPSMGVLWVDYVQAYLGTARGTFINRNNFAGFIEMIWPLALGVTLAMTGRVHSLKEALDPTGSTGRH